MLSRLADLRQLAHEPVSAPIRGKGEDGEEYDVPAASSTDPAPAAEVIDLEWQEYLQDQEEMFQEILEDEGIVIQACGEVRGRVHAMKEIVDLETEALLPSKLTQLAQRFESQELVCQRMIRRAKDALGTLKDAIDEDLEDDEQALRALIPVRDSIAKARGIEFKSLVQGFFQVRSLNRQEMIQRARRQLRFAYPDALDEEIDDIMEFPELAFTAVTRRLENGPEVTLDGILGDMEGKKADARKLEQGAKELKLMFLQFAELIDTQGENLTAIEANIKTVIEETTEAITILQDAEAEKRAYERKKLKFYVIIFIVFLYMGGSKLFTKDANGHSVAGDLTASVLAPVEYVGGKAVQAAEKGLAKDFPETEKKLKAAESAAEKDVNAAENAVEKAEGKAPAPAAKKEGDGNQADAGNDQKNGDAGQGSLLQKSSYIASYLPKRWWHKAYEHDAVELKASDSAVTKDRRPSSGFIPRRTPLLDNPVVRSVAVLARGGASRHSSLRKQRAKGEEENNTAVELLGHSPR